MGAQDTKQDISQQASGEKIKSLGFDNLLEDIFGLNFRGLKSLWVSFLNPKAYYQAAWQPNWGGRFTPSFRLWFSLTLLSFFFQFFWASNGSALISLYEDMIVKSGLVLPSGVSSRDAAIAYSRIYFSFIPFSNALGYFIIALLFPFWGQKTPIIVRIRYIFITATPITFFTFLAYITLAYIPADGVILWSIINILLTVFFYFITGLRGAFYHLSMGQRWWRALVLSFFILVTIFIMAGVAQMISVLILADRYAPLLAS